MERFFNVNDPVIYREIRTSIGPRVELCCHTSEQTARMLDYLREKCDNFRYKIMAGIDGQLRVWIAPETAETLFYSERKDFQLTEDILWS